MPHQQSEFDAEGGANVLIHGLRDDNFEQRLRADFAGAQFVIVESQTFSAMLKELRRINFQLSLMTGVTVNGEMEGQ